jgi:hypothetical protein
MRKSLHSKSRVRASRAADFASKRFRVEPLEQRWLLSATPTALALAAAGELWDDPERPDIAVVSSPEVLLAEQPQAQALADAPSVLDLSRHVGQAVTAEPSWPVGMLLVDQVADTSPERGAQFLRVDQALTQALATVSQAVSTWSPLKWLQSFPGDGSSEDPSALETVRQRLEAGAWRPQWVLADDTQMQGAQGAYAAVGPSGAETIFVNAGLLSTAGGDDALVAVLVEEIGHALDVALHGDRDSPGDEGERFAATVLGHALSPSDALRIAREDDRGVVHWGMDTFVVEQATFSGTVLEADGYVDDGDIKVNGAATIRSTDTLNGGRLIVGINQFSSLNGNGDTTSDTLTLQASGNVRVWGTIGGSDPLEALTIEGVSGDLPGSVIFENEVTLSGPLTIYAVGDVVFNKRLTITGGDLTILGASKIEFMGGVSVGGGDVELQADEVNFIGSGAISSPGGTLSIRTTTLGLGMEVGNPSQEDATKLNLTLQELDLIGAGQFALVRLGASSGGHAVAGQGAVRIGSVQTANQYTFYAPLEVYAASIRIEDVNNAAQPAFAVKGALRLDATGHIEIGNRVVASTDLSQASAYQDITLYSSGGKVTQYNDTRPGLGDGVANEPLQGKRLTVEARDGIDLMATEVVEAVLVNTGTAGTVEGTSSSSLSVSTGTKTLTTQTGKTWTGGAAGSWVTIVSASNDANRMYGRVSAYNAGDGTMTVDVFESAGSGTATDWRIVSSADIRLVETAAGGALTLLRAQQTGAGSTAGVYVQTLSTSSDDPGHLTVTPTQAGYFNTPAGSIGLRAGGDLTLGVNADLINIVGTLDLVAGGAISMVTTGGTRSERNISATGDVRLQAGGDIAVGEITSAGDVALISGGSISDGDAATDIFSQGLYLQSGTSGGIGSGTDAIDSRVGTLALSAGSGGAFVNEADAVAVDTVSVAVSRIDAAARSVTVQSAQTWSDLVSVSNGSIALVLASGSLTLGDGTDADGMAVSAHGSGSVLIDVNVGNLVVNSDIVSGTGHLTLKAASDVLLGSVTAAGVDVSTATGGTVSVDAEAGALTMAGTATVTATGSSARLNAATDVTLGNVVATNVSVVADTGAIVNAAGSTKNVTATSLRLQADDAIGVAARHITTNVGTLTARSTGTTTAGIFVSEDDALAVDTVGVTVTMW